MRRFRDFVITGSIILTLSNVAIRALSYLYRIVLGRILSPYEYGILNLALPLQFMIIVLTSSGIAPSVAKFVSEKKAKEEDVSRLVSSSIFYYTLGGAGLGIIFYLLSWPLGIYVFGDANTVLPLKISAVAIPFGILVAVYTGVFQGLRKIGYMSGALFFEQVMRVVFAVGLVLAGLGAAGAIGGSTLGFAMAVPLSYLLFKKLGLHFDGYDYSVFREVFYFSIPTSITALSSFFLAYADTLLIGYYMTPSDVGIYSAASPASRLILSFTTAFYAVLIPAVSELYAKGVGQEVKKYFKLALSVTVLVVLPATILSYIFSTQLITILFTEVYLSAVPSFKILIVGVAFLSLFMTNSAIFQGLGLAKIPMKILLIFAALDVLLNLILIPLYGIEGAAFSTALASAGAGVVSTALLAKYLNTIE